MASGKISTGVQFGAWSVLMYGTGGIGKSTWAGNAPGAIFIPVGEDGSRNLDVARVPLCETWEDILGYANAIIAGKGKYDGVDCGTLVIDTVDGAEKLAWNYVCRTQKTKKGETAKDIESFDYQAGYTMALEPWRQLLSKLQVIKGMGINVVLISHLRTLKYNNPCGADYDRYCPDLHKLLSPLLHNWVDCTLFAYEDVSVVEKRGGKAKAFSSGVRKCHTRESAAYVAKERYGLPDPMELDFDKFAYHLPEESAKRKQVEASTLESRLIEMGGETYADRVKLAITKCNGEPRKLEIAINNLQAKLASDLQEEEESEKEEGNDGSS